MRLPCFAWIPVVWLACSGAQAMFMYEPTQQVPIPRLFANFEQRLARDTNDFEATYHLARLHAMVYATKRLEEDLEAVKTTGRPVFAMPGQDSGVPQGVTPPADKASRERANQHLTNAIELYARALPLLDTWTNLGERVWLVLPMRLGQAWCLDQAGRRDEALRAYRQALRIAWNREVTREFHFKTWIIERWGDVRAGRSPFHLSRQDHIGPGVCFSEEIIGYLLKLLDPVKDAREIARLNKDREILGQMGRAISPILVPLAADVPFEQLVDPAAGVDFDLDGSGRARKWGWITPKAAWLVFDADGSGRITSAVQMFGNVTFWMMWRDGYDALAALDDDGDGVLRGAELAGLALWHDRNGNGRSDAGEVQPVSSYGISALACRCEPHPTGMPWSSEGVTFSDGRRRPTYDWIAPESAAGSSHAAAGR